MSRPMPWSFTVLDDFVNCPYAFYRKRVKKDIIEERGEHLIWGERVHKAFELYVKCKTKLHGDFSHHEPFLHALATAEGNKFCEKRVALNVKLKPTGFFDKDVWHRGVLDYGCINGDFAHVVDYKTGKPHNKPRQLKIFALNILAEYPRVDEVKTEYYWTQTGGVTGAVYYRSEWKQLWNELTPDLKQYLEAFKTDTWQKRQSGLCNGWCPVTNCEFWRPRRR